MEQWKMIEGIDSRTKYEVSSLGNFRSVDRISKVNGRVICGKALKQFHRGKDPNNYLTVCVGNKTHLSHRLVAASFVPNPENKPEINHKNGIKWDNRVENLEWVTRLENVQHSILNNFPNHKIFDADVLFIRRNFKKMGKKELAKMFNVSEAYIYAISVHKEKKNVLTPVFQESSPIHTKTVIQIDSNGDKVAEYNSISEAARALGCTIYRIQRVLMGIRKKYKGFVFKFKNEEVDFNYTTQLKPIKSGKSYKVSQIDKNGNVVANYKSVFSAAKTLGFSETSIKNVLFGVQKTHKGFFWKIIE